MDRKRFRGRSLKSACMLTAAFLLITAIAQFQAAAQHEDPLTEAQADQVRELGDQPVERIKLYLKFVEERVAAIRELSVDTHENNRPAEMGAKLEEFTRLSDELAENIDTYNNAHADIRKALKVVVDASSKWPEALRRVPPDPAYDFALRTALDAATSSNEETKRLLAEQTTYFAAHKDEAGKNGKAPTPP